MAGFYLHIWLKWAVRLALCTLVLASGVTFLITAFLYINQGMPSLSSEVVAALLDLFKFWFPIAMSFTLLIALFRSIKFIFKRCYNGYKFELLSCAVSDSEEVPLGYDGKEIIKYIGYGDLVKVWRRWFMIIIWLVGAQMVFALAFTNLFTSYSGVFEWFSIYWLFGFLLIAGYLSFVLLGSRCKQVKVVRC